MTVLKASVVNQCIWQGWTAPGVFKEGHVHALAGLAAGSIHKGEQCGKALIGVKSCNGIACLF